MVFLTQNLVLSTKPCCCCS